MRVLSSIGTRYTVLDISTNNKQLEVHVSRLRPFNHNPIHTDPVQVANADQNHFMVERIVQHRGHIRRKKTLFFETKWQGFPDSENTWLPYSELRDNIYLHDYLHANNLRHLIPKQHLPTP